MGEALGLDFQALAGHVALVVAAILVIFFVISPIGGYFLFRLLRRVTPMPDTFALWGAALIGFLVAFTVLLLGLLRLVPLSEANLGPLLLISGAGALLVTGVTAIGIRVLARRSAANLEDYAFRVWGEDRRQKPRNRRQR
jgi:hypothetical protein